MNSSCSLRSGSYSITSLPACVKCLRNLVLDKMSKSKYVNILELPFFVTSTFMRLIATQPINSTGLQVRPPSGSELCLLQAWRAVDRAYYDKSFNGKPWFKVSTDLPTRIRFLLVKSALLLRDSWMPRLPDA